MLVNTGPGGEKVHYIELYSDNMLPSQYHCSMSGMVDSVILC